MKPIILQDKGGNILEIFADGRIICDCLHNLFLKNRNVCSECRHQKKLLNNIIKGNLIDYYEIKQ